MAHSVKRLAVTRICVGLLMFALGVVLTLFAGVALFIPLNEGGERLDPATLTYVDGPIEFPWPWPILTIGLIAGVLICWWSSRNLRKAADAVM